VRYRTVVRPAPSLTASIVCAMKAKSLLGKRGNASAEVARPVGVSVFKSGFYGLEADFVGRDKAESSAKANRI
jgi:hypothetical protein